VVDWAGNQIFMDNTATQRLKMQINEKCELKLFVMKRSNIMWIVKIFM